MSRDTETAWAAGLFEGEGSVWRVTRRNDNQRDAWHAGICMTDLDVIERFAKWAGCGNIYKLKDQGFKQAWRWQTGKRENVYQICQRLLPHMGIRRRTKMEEAMVELPPFGRIDRL